MEEITNVVNRLYTLRAGLSEMCKLTDKMFDKQFGRYSHRTSLRVIRQDISRYHKKSLCAGDSQHGGLLNCNYYIDYYQPFSDDPFALSYLYE